MEKVAKALDKVTLIIMMMLARLFMSIVDGSEAVES